MDLKINFIEEYKILGYNYILLKWQNIKRSHRINRKIKSNKKLFKKNHLLHGKNSDYKKTIDLYWKKYYGKKVDYSYHIAIKNVTGKEDVRFIPHYIWLEIIEFFNSELLVHSYNDKNLSEILFPEHNRPLTIIKNINGYFYNKKHKIISRSEAEKEVLNGPNLQIIKPSQTNSGVGIRRIENHNNKIIISSTEVSFEQLEALYKKDFIIQEKINQHEVMASPHPDSINTVRLVTFRWKGVIQVLLAFARFGQDGTIMDNAGQGGISCGISESGELNKFAIDLKGKTYYQHPTTNFSFKDQCIFIPNWGKVCEEGIRLHKYLFHCDIANWDFAIGKGGEPIFIEVNYKGTSWGNQFVVQKPILGELTEEVLEALNKKDYKKY